MTRNGTGAEASGSAGFFGEYTKAHYSVEASVHKFVDMERKAIGE